MRPLTKVSSGASSPPPPDAATCCAACAGPAGSAAATPAAAPALSRSRRDMRVLPVLSLLMAYSSCAEARMPLQSQVQFRISWDLSSFLLAHPSVDDQPSAERVLLLIAGLRPVADTGREHRLQSRPLCRREGHGIVGLLERLGLALDDVGRNVRPGDLAREGVRRIQVVARRSAAHLVLGDERRSGILRVAAFLQCGGLVLHHLVDLADVPLVG